MADEVAQYERSNNKCYASVFRYIWNRLASSHARSASDEALVFGFSVIIFHSQSNFL